MVDIGHVADAARRQLHAPVVDSEQTESALAGAAVGILAATSPVQNGLEQAGRKIAKAILIDPKTGNPNDVGRELGMNNKGAIIAISGALPGLLINSLAMIQAVNLRRVNPKLSSALLAYSITNHALLSIQPWSAAVMSAHEIKMAADQGQVFAKLAVELHNTTGLSVKLLATSAAVAWTFAVPAICLAFFLKKGGANTEIVPNAMALRYWLSQAKDNEETRNLLEALYAKYPGKEKFQKAIEGDNLEKINSESDKFSIYLMNHLPKKELTKAKRKILEKQISLYKPSKKERIFSIISLSSLAAFWGVEVLRIIGETVAPVIQPVSEFLPNLAPGFAALSLLSMTHNTYKEVTSNDPHITKKVKMLSLANLIIAISTNTFFVVGVFVPGLNAAIATSYTAGAVSMLIIGYVKNNSIKGRMIALHATEEENFSFMLKWYIQSPNKKDPRLQNWLEDLKRAKRIGHITDRQKLELVIARVNL